MNTRKVSAAVTFLFFVAIILKRYNKGSQNYAKFAQGEIPVTILQGFIIYKFLNIAVFS